MDNKCWSPFLALGLHMTFKLFLLSLKLHAKFRMRMKICIFLAMGNKGK